MEEEKDMNKNQNEIFWSTLAFLFVLIEIMQTAVFLKKDSIGVLISFFIITAFLFLIPQFLLNSRILNKSYLERRPMLRALLKNIQEFGFLLFCIFTVVALSAFTFNLNEFSIIVISVLGIFVTLFALIYAYQFVPDKIKREIRKIKEERR